ncbi:Rha family transcriptional regulator [Paenibacillus polymyxa]|uniref:Rha family transcriptional regulator n=1 Tax=Paenibacillus polymyxa TaxID=1406 RepID=UPI00287FBF85|nr:Rha family transcriptional regulator [Paenibacillus polymyxa]
MIGKEHSNLMRDIRGYVGILDDPDSNLNSAEFFIAGSYIDAQNQERSCFELTRKGCDMVANKMTGEKGVRFTATYVSKFEEMEKQLQKLSPLEVMQMAVNQLVEHEKELKSLKKADLMLETNINELREDFKKYKVRLGDRSSFIVARDLVLFSNNDKPHSNFIDCVAKKLKIYSGSVGDQNEYINVVMENTHQGTAGVTVHYSEKAVNLMKEYLSDNFKMEIEYYKNNYKQHKKGDIKEYVYKADKKFNFNKKTYDYYLKLR